MLRFVCIVCFLVGSAISIDLTRVPNANGAEVVEAVVNIIRESCLFADDKRFLRRLAYVESEDGLAPKTYRVGYNGGIWQVDETAFKETQNQQTLSAEYSLIRSRIGINWPLVTWDDLRKPLYSGIAAALYTLLKGPGGDAITWKVEEQGQFWSKYFHTGRSATNFTQLATLLDLGCHTNQQVDLVFVVDSSSSLSLDDFQRALNFVDLVVSGFTISPSDTRVGLVTYSTDVRVEFRLNSFSTYSSLQTAISSVQYHSGATATAAAIDKAVKEVFRPFYGGRTGVVKVMVVITDGDSDDAINTRHAAERAQANSIVIFSVGVGRAIHMNELNTVATNPDCTHAYQVKDYAEIRFLTEEIQHATCIAPLFINNTYSCEISRCPPLAVVSPHGGVTIETNITCGGMNIYSAFNNPYPNRAQYEPPLVTSNAGHPTQTFYNATAGETLYMTLKDNQGFSPNFNGSTGCIATVTPYHGDHTDQTVSVKCFQNDHEIPCKESYFNCTEKWNFPNPCTQANILAGKLRFPHPYQANKYIMCDMTGKEYVVICPPGEIFQADCSACIGAGSVSTANCKNSLNTTAVANPCTVENILAGNSWANSHATHEVTVTIMSNTKQRTKVELSYVLEHRSPRPGWASAQTDHRALRPMVTDTIEPRAACACSQPGRFYFKYPGSKTKYIQCDIWGHPWERDCRSGMEWEQSEVTCIVPAAFDPCRHHDPSQPYLYPHQCDPHKFIHCDMNGQSFVQMCQLDYLFLPASQTCIPIGFPGSETLVYTCNGAHQGYTQPQAVYTTKASVTGATVPAGYTYTSQQWQEPCTLHNIQNSNLYFPYLHNNHMYIQCDLYGNQYLRDCSSSGRDYYDPDSHTCVDGPVHVDSILGG